MLPTSKGVARVTGRPVCRRNNDQGTLTIDASPGGGKHSDSSRNSRLTAWFEAWRPSMCRWVSSRSSIQTADLDDVAQEVFLRLLRYSDDAVVEHPQSYLFRIATNVVNEWRERARNSLPHDDAWLADLQIERDNEPESWVEHTLVNEKVRSAVSRLPLRQREVLLLHIRDDLTYKQIAAKLQLTTRVVRRDIARAYAQLRDELHSVDLDGYYVQATKED
jgi:RNA polymerase sigma factor (sigma-70 family)